MTFCNWFWLFYVLAFLSVWLGYYDSTANSLWYRRAGALTVLWLLVGILGYRVCGSVVK
jgi:hypothetical protein